MTKISTKVVKIGAIAFLMYEKIVKQIQKSSLKFCYLVNNYYLVSELKR